MSGEFVSKDSALATALEILADTLLEQQCQAIRIRAESTSGKPTLKIFVCRGEAAETMDRAFEAIPGVEL